MVLEPAQMASLYEHRPLTLPNSIRVLTLKPAISWQAPIECSLDEIDLDNITRSSSYEALSYVWGERFGTIPIICNGKQLLVTPNCRDALLQLRKPSKPRRLFIDAICIDQRQEASSLVERENQIALMGRVYEQAYRVVIWLENTHPAIPGLFKLLRLLSWTNMSRNFGGGQKRNVRGSFRQINLLLGFIIWSRDLKRDEAAKLENAFYALMENNWFKRVWTMQEEICANPKTSIIMCGHSKIKYATFQSAFGRLRHLWLSDRQFASWAIIVARITVHEMLSPTQAAEQGIGPMVSKTTMFWKNLHNLDSTIPEDKIFGIYGIFNKLGPDLAPKPDYSMTVADVFATTTKAIIRQSHSLQILGICSREACITEGLPSWVPDWVMKWPEKDAKVVTDGVFMWDMSPGGGYRAAKTTTPKVNETSSVGRLSLLGAIIGKVDFLTVSATIGSAQAHENGDIPWRDYIQACRTWCQKVASFSTYCNGYPTFDAAACTLLMDEYEDATVSARSVATFDIMCYPDCKEEPGLKEFVDSSFIEMQLSHPSADSENDVLAIWLSHVLKEQPLGIKKMMVPARRWANYAFMVLDTGHFARGLYVCKEGDVVALLAGCDFPAALRPDGTGNYRFVAPLYVHGIMFGEAWPEDESKLEEIVLV
ncbi:heterokaryon incompatibility protein-domain-containing protein [Xylaria palmicola]|nr:heterokaryon incompatibility protein-domain-containing protein [Xylaria palmicola]